MVNGLKLAMVVRVQHQPTLIYKCNLLHKTLITKSTTTSANFLLCAVHYCLAINCPISFVMSAIC